MVFLRPLDNGDSSSLERSVRITFPDVGAVAVNPLGHLFAGAGGSVFDSTSDGDSWNDVSFELPGGNVSALTIDPAGYAYAGTARSCASPGLPGRRPPLALLFPSGRRVDAGRRDVRAEAQGCRDMTAAASEPTSA